MILSSRESREESLSEEYIGARNAVESQVVRILAAVDAAVSGNPVYRVTVRLTVRTTLTETRLQSIAHCTNRLILSKTLMVKMSMVTGEEN